MRMSSILIASVAALGLIAGPALAGPSKSEEAHEKPISLAQVPKPAMDAAKKALGGDITEAETIQGQRGVYELSMKDASGKEKAVHVTSADKILKTETEAKDRD